MRRYQVLVECSPGVIIWKNFGIQNNYDEVVYSDGFESIGPFTFDGTQYYELFEKVRAIGIK